MTWIAFIPTTLFCIGALWCTRRTAHYRRQAEESARRAVAAAERARAALDTTEE
jgi:hypothetical protein